MSRFYIKYLEMQKSCIIFASDFLSVNAEDIELNYILKVKESKY